MLLCRQVVPLVFAGSQQGAEAALGKFQNPGGIQEGLILQENPLASLPCLAQGCKPAGQRNLFAAGYFYQAGTYVLLADGI